MEQITHDHVKRLVYQLPKPFQDKYFMWRRNQAEVWRNGGRASFYFSSPEFIAECLQKAISLHAEVDRVLTAWSADKTDS